MTEQQLKPCNNNKNLKNADNTKKASNGSHHHNSAPRKQSRKSENPSRFVPPKPNVVGLSPPTSWTCKNSACKALVPIDLSFCKRCSCCICHQFDDNKDPSLWLVCEPESGNNNGGDYCGQSAHVECAFQRAKVGVVNPGQYMNLDGSYCCASCGKVQGILGFWKKQLAIAKDARRVDVLCDRIFLSYRLLKGTVKFVELHEIVAEAKTKLEAEVGPMDGESLKMVRGIVSRLSVAGDVQMLCSRAIDKVDEWLANGGANRIVDTLPAACQFLFGEVTSSSLQIILIDIPTAQTQTEPIRGYKMWFCETRNGSFSFSRDPLKVFSRERRRVVVECLEPCTEYAFRIVSYTDSGDLGHSEAKCFTKSIEVLDREKGKAKAKNKDNKSGGPSRIEKEDLNLNPDGFKIRECGKYLLRLMYARERGALDEISSATVDKEEEKEEAPIVVVAPVGPIEEPQPRVGLDLNVATTVPDLNEDLTPPIDSSRDEEDNNGFSPDRADGGPIPGPEENGYSLDRADGGPIPGPEENNGYSPDGPGPEPEEKRVVSNHGSGMNGGGGVDGGGPAPVDSKLVDSKLVEGSKLVEDSKLVEGSKMVGARRKRKDEEAQSDSALIHDNGKMVGPGLGPDVPGMLDDTFEFCVKMIRIIECQGYISPEFRLKLLTWFSLRSTEQERRVVNTFIHALADDHKSLAGQLVDTFSEVIAAKKPRNRFTSPL